MSVDLDPGESFRGIRHESVGFGWFQQQNANRITDFYLPEHWRKGQKQQSQRGREQVFWAVNGKGGSAGYLLLAAEEGTTEYAENTEWMMRLGATKSVKGNSREFGPGWMRWMGFEDAPRGAFAVSCYLLPAARY
ncbi:MAG: hypothetical protein MUF31_06895 [Akkermansiaceae bacterium]|nr:hypothetical protein [Akkermansiaceae bacterium]